MRTKDGAIRENPVKTDGYQMLANAIILQAVQDYRKAKRVLNTYRGDSQFGTPLGRTGQTIPTVRAEKMMRETERFFRSKWFQILSGVDPETLIKRLKEEDAE